MTIERPKTNCKGCDARDRIIALIAKALDESSRVSDILTRPPNCVADRVQMPIEPKSSTADLKPAA